MPVGAVDDPHFGQLDAAFRFEVPNAVLVLDRLRLLGPRWHAAGEESECAERGADETSEQRSWHAAIPRKQPMVTLSADPATRAKRTAASRWQAERYGSGRL